MSVNIYTFQINPDEEYLVSGMKLVTFIGSILDDNIVQNKKYDVLPDWVSNQNIQETHKVLTFSYQNTDFCIICYTPTNVSSAILVEIVGKNAVGGVRSSRIEQITSTSKTLNFLIGQNNDYFLFCHRGGYNTYFGVFRIDAPTNADDTNVYVSAFNGGNICYTKPFRNEDISVRTYFVSDMPNLGTYPYEHTFTKNFYNNKIPVYNVYAHTSIYGTRGKLTNLILLPNSYSLSPLNFYMVNGDKYCAFGTLGIEYAGTVLVRVK